MFEIAQSSARNLFDECEGVERSEPAAARIGIRTAERRLHKLRRIKAIFGTGRAIIDLADANDNGGAFGRHSAFESVFSYIR
jgi:hypothetical protein